MFIEIRFLRAVSWLRMANLKLNENIKEFVISLISKIIKYIGVTLVEKSRRVS
jgi:hypothetical protein